MKPTTASRAKRNVIACNWVFRKNQQIINYKKGMGHRFKFGQKQSKGQSIKQPLEPAAQKQLVSTILFQRPE